MLRLSVAKLAALFALSLAAFGCGGGGAKSFSVGGTVTGLSAGQIVLQLSTGDQITIANDGSFAFPSGLAAGMTYEITVVSAPTKMLVTVNNGSGMVDGTIADIEIVVEPGYEVTANVSGLSGPVVLQLNGGHDVTMNADGSATFPTLLPSGATYSVSLSSAPASQSMRIGNGSGTIAASDVTDVEVRGRHWTRPADDDDNISPDGQHAYMPFVVSNANGDAVITWYQSDGARQQVFKSEYRNGTWTHPASLTDNVSADGQSASEPRAAMDDAGNAIIVWRQSDGSRSQIFKSEYRNGSWLNPASLSDNISPSGQHAYDPTVAMDNNGNAVIVWYQYDGSRYRVFKSEYRNGNWTHPASLTDSVSLPTTSAYEPQVALDDNGNAVIVWYQYDGNEDQIFKSEYRNGAWIHPSGLADNISPDAESAYEPQIASSASGDLVIVWYQYDGNVDRIYMSEYRAGTWTHPATLADAISPDDDDAWDPRVAMHTNGDALIVWTQYDATDDQIFLSHYHNGAWDHPDDIDDHISPDATDSGGEYPSAAFGPNGDAMVAWYGWDNSNYYIYHSRLVRGSWTHPAFQTTLGPDAVDCYEVSLTIDGRGDAMVTYYGDAASHSQVFVSTYR